MSILNRIISARPWTTWACARGSSMQPASRSATPRRCSISRSTSTPASDDKHPPSKRATTDLPQTGDRPGSGSIRSSMADGLPSKIARIDFSNQILRDCKGLSYIRRPP